MTTCNFRLPQLVLSLIPLLALGCGSTDGPRGGPVLPVGSYAENPAGGFFFVDAHQAGTTLDLHLAGVSWGRLVDVHALDEDGAPTLEPIARDYVIRESLDSIPGDYTLDTDTATSSTRLVIHRRLGDPDTGGGSFDDLLRAAGEGLAPVLDKGDGPTAAGPFSFFARNATLVLQFDDLLADEDEIQLSQMVGVLIGSPPTVPFPARLLFDPNHGGLAQAEFHSSRILVDMTVSLLEMERMGTPLNENAVGLPASHEDDLGPSVSIRIPSRTDFGAGQFQVLTSTFGGALAASGNGPVDFSSGTLDVVRALRAGNADDMNNGFLRDEEPPVLLGTWPLLITTALPNPSGEPGRDFVASVTFQNACQRALQEDDVLSTGDRFLQVQGTTLPPNAGGRIADVRLRVLGARQAVSSELLGPAGVTTPFEDSGSIPMACWALLLPSSSEIPGTRVSPGALIAFGFSEPMDPAGLARDGGLQLVRGDASQAATAIDRVVGSVVQSSNGKSFTFVPRLPLDHVQGVAERLTLHLNSGSEEAPLVTDLAGNPLVLDLPPIEFVLDPLVPTARTGGVTLDFASIDEYNRNDPSSGTPDLRGQVTYDLGRSVLKPRSVARQSWTIDSNAALPSLMFQLPVGIPEPLTPLGSKLQTLWRYADIGWDPLDESKYDLDVEGIAWRPFPGSVNSEFYEGFSISLAHSSRLPDETLATPGALFFPQSGLLDQPAPFSSNVLNDPASPQKVVHGRSLGYEVNPSLLFRAANGTDMMPFPLNRAGGPHETFTWRDTSVLATGGLQGGGIPLGIEAMVGPSEPSGSIAGAGAVPSFGLPLLMEFGCYPSDFGIGVNTFTLAVASLGQLMPNFRIHSTGGSDTSGTIKRVNPDAHEIPNGGYDPTSTPPGMKTRSADPTIYFGQLDTVTRVSRVFTVWFDTESVSPNYVEPIVLPAPDEQPEDTYIEFAYRGARTFTATMGAELDATMLNAYGDISEGTIDFLPGGGLWHDSIDAIDGARHIQVRITFLNNVITGATPELDAFSIAYTR